MPQNININDDLKLHWSSFLAGNDDALSEIYGKLVNNLFAFGATFTTDSELIKDCIQDVFIRLFQNRTQLTTVNNIRVYLLVALKNALIDAFKKQRVYQKFIASYKVEERTADSREEQIIAQEFDIAVQNLTAKYKSVLTKRQWEIIHYRFVEELSIEEISNLLNINYQTVANSLQKSLKKIRNNISENGV